jgi:rhodanese-related sulfurtransferase
LGQGSADVNLASFRKFGVAGAPISTYIRRRGVIADTPSDGRSSKFCATRNARSATMDEGRFSISAQSLYERLGGPAAPILIDARRAPTFDADPWMIVGAVRRPPDTIAQWGANLPPGHPVVVYCAHGREISRDTAASLRGIGLNARYLDGGIADWAERKFPMRRKVAQSLQSGASQSWVTRERPKIDRIACPWLIRRFIDPEASFLFVPTERVFGVARETGAVAYDIPGAEPFSHDGELCSFDAFLKVYGVADPALDLLAVIVRGADTARLELAPQSPGLLALSLGLSANFADDHEMLEHGITMYDAFYAWCRSCQDQTHNWNPQLRA